MIKKLYCPHKSFKVSIKSKINTKKAHKVIQFNQKPKSDFEKDFFKLMNNAVFGKTMKNLRKHRDIKLVTTNNRRNHLVSEPNHQTKMVFRKSLKNRNERNKSKNEKASISRLINIRD